MTWILQGLGHQPGNHGFYVGWGMGLSGAQLDIPDRLRGVDFVVCIVTDITGTVVV